MPAQPPLCLAMLICDAVHVDRITSKVTILGVFEEIRVERFPAAISPVTVYCELAGGRGRSELELEFQHVPSATAERRLLARATLELELASPARAAQVYFAFEELELPCPGVHGFFLKSDGSHVAERALIALQ